MAKTSIDTGADGEAVHTRSTGGSEESQVAVIGIDGSDSVVPAHATDGLSVKLTNGSVPVTDNAGSLTVDAPLSTPVGVRLSDGSGALATTSSELHIRDVTARSTLASILSALGSTATEATLLDILTALGSGLVVDASGSSVTLGAALPAGTNAIGKLSANSGVDIGDVDVTSLPALPAGSNNIGQVDPRGNVAHDGADSGNPVKVGAKALTTLAAVSASGDRTDITADKFGRLLALAAPLDQRVTGTANFTNNSAADVIAAPGASIGIVVTDIVVTNGHATVATKVSIRDNATVKFTGYACAAGGGFALSNPDGLFVAAANAPIRAICGTTGADVDVSISGYKIPA